MATPGKLSVGSDGKVRGPARIAYNSPFPCVNGQYGSGAMRGVIMHTMVCDLATCIKIFNDRAKQASAHFGIDQSGSIFQFGPIGKGWIAWAQAAGNAAWYSIEHADHGDPNQPLTAAQIAASAQVVECLSSYAGFPLAVTDSTSGRGYGVHNMGGAAWGGHTCPDLPPKHVRSAQRGAIIALAKDIHAGKASSSSGGSQPVAGKRFDMFDDVTVSLLPPGAPAYACYVNGRYANCSAVRGAHPGAHILDISVFASGDATCLDVEPGDATNADAPGWFARQVKRGVHRPVLYTSASNAAALISYMSRAGHPRSSFRLWSAHYSGEHVCGTGGCSYPKADATQWTDRALGRSLDQSLCEPDFFGAPATTAPAPQPAATEEDDMQGMKLPETVGETASFSWPNAAWKGMTVITDSAGPVVFAVKELHTTPNNRWLDKDDIKVSVRSVRNFGSDGADTAGVQLTLKSGTGSSSLHTYT